MFDNQRPLFHFLCSTNSKRKGARLLTFLLLGSFLFHCGDDLAVVEGKELPIPKQLLGKKEGDTRVFSLELKKGMVEFFTGKKTATFGINGPFLGPTIQVEKGEKVQINVLNSLGEKSTLHWHGMHIPAKMDGGPHQVIEAGKTWKPHFTIMQVASTNWYHPHFEGKTGIQVYKGLAGLFMISDGTAEKLKLPRKYGVDDIPLVLQDRRFDSSGAFLYLERQRDRMMGMKGDKIVVNGAFSPKWTAPAQIVRFRILNGSNARFYNIGLSDDKAFHLIATDGGFLEKSVKLTRLLLTPGERAEILVDLSKDKGKTLSLKSYSSEIVSVLGGGMHADALDESNFTLLNISVTKDAVAQNKIPDNLVKIVRLKASDAKKTRKFVLRMTGGGNPSFTINGKSMKMDRIDETVKLGDTEIWEVTNDSGMPHPFHIHDVSFLILDRDGKAPHKYETGWKDTVLVKPKEVVRFIAKFEDFSDPKFPYMFHCHILEHEDGGMMGQFIVVK